MGCQTLAAHELEEDGLGMEDGVCGCVACGQVDAEEIIYRGYVMINCIIINFVRYIFFN